MLYINIFSFLVISVGERKDFLLMSGEFVCTFNTSYLDRFLEIVSNTETRQCHRLSSLLVQSFYFIIYTNMSHRSNLSSPVYFEDFLTSCEGAVELILCVSDSF